MENPKQDIVNSVLIPILSTDATAVHSVVEQYCSDDVVFHHPAFILKGKQEFQKMYLGWSKQNYDFNKLTVHAVFYDEEIGRVVTDITYQFHPMFFPTRSPQTARVITMFHLRPVKRAGSTRYLITRQEDYYPTDAICAAVTPEPLSSMVKWGVQTAMRCSGLFTIHIFGTLSVLASSVVETLGFKDQHVAKEVIMETVDDDHRVGGVAASEHVCKSK
ncbi:hypothetical protein HKX48_001742 [Thoreauomyces humboldtii]|nr:hypothetical protein HKX48_001742 [Thoreauomyces humboldtii]